jgi:hypothetical protein
MRTASFARSKGCHMTPEKSDQSPIDPAELDARSRRDWTYRPVPGLRRYEAAGAGFDRTHTRTPNKLAGNAQTIFTSAHTVD